MSEHVGEHEHEDDDEDLPRLYFGNVDEFVREILIKVYQRQVGERAQLRWSVTWWESPEALTRITALWCAWEHLRLDPALGSSTWFRDHGDPHMHELMSPNGPFKQSTDSNRPGEFLPYEDPPEGLFPDIREPIETEQWDPL